MTHALHRTAGTRHWASSQDSTGRNAPSFGTVLDTIVDHPSFRAQGLDLHTCRAGATGCTSGVRDPLFQPLRYEGPWQGSRSDLGGGARAPFTSAGLISRAPSPGAPRSERPFPTDWRLGRPPPHRPRPPEPVPYARACSSQVWKPLTCRSPARRPAPPT